MTALALSGVALPDDEPRDLFVLGDRITLTRPAGPVTTVADGGWLLPGLVDVHSHPGLSGTFEEDSAAMLAGGVTAARAPGLTVPLPDDLSDHPRLTVATAWLMHTSLGEGMPLHTHTDDLAAAARDLARPGGWVKLVGDWGAEAAPLDQLRAAVAVAHQAGARVAVHCQSVAGCAAAVASGADSLEHGMHLDHDLLPVMAAQGTALVPTLSVFQDRVDEVRTKPDSPRKTWFVTGVDGLAPTVAAAREAGVRVFAGTDAAPDSTLVDEVLRLARAGLPVVEAIGAASWDARSWLGWPSLVEGAPADVVVYDEDPRRNPEVLRHPRHVISRGRVLR